MSKLFDQNYLKKILAITAGNIYWLDRQGLYQGCNNNALSFFGLSSTDDVVGRTDLELVSSENLEAAASFRRDDFEVMQTGRGKYDVEEPPYVDKNGNVVHFLTTRVPIIDDNGEVIGIVGTSIDITSRKKTEQELRYAKEQAEQYSLLARQIAHDIRSPLAAISMLAESCKEIPEAERVCLREAVSRAQDIANEFLAKHKNVESGVDESVAPVLVSSAVLSLLSSKRVEYQHTDVKLIFEADAEAYFVFIWINIVEFKRVLSNLINNAVEAMQGVEGKVVIRIKKLESGVVISVSDTGCGIPQEKINKILQDTRVETTKKQGYGLGLSYTKAILEKYDADLTMSSCLGQGTTVFLNFKRITSPAWAINQIKIHQDNIVVILDDDESIHSAWDKIFSSISGNHHVIKIMHFTAGQSCIDFLSEQANKENIVLLTDYELLGQLVNGLDVIERSNIVNAILVTSHYENQEVIDRAISLKTRILPKMLASYIDIIFVEKQGSQPADQEKVDLVVVDDQECFTMALEMIFKEKGRAAKIFRHPEELLAALPTLPKEVKICTDYDFGAKMTGIDLAAVLYQQGYTHLYLATGHELSQENVPAYVTVVSNKAMIADL